MQTKLKRYTASKKYEQFSLNVKSKVKRLYLYTVMVDSFCKETRIERNGQYKMQTTLQVGFKKQTRYKMQTADLV